MTAPTHTRSEAPPSDPRSQPGASGDKLPELNGAERSLQTAQQIHRSNLDLDNLRIVHHLIRFIDYGCVHKSDSVARG